MFGLSSKEQGAQKMAIILFADPNQMEGKKRALHGFVYAKELSEKGKQVRLLFDGMGVAIIEKVGGKDKELSELFSELNIGVYSDSKIQAGACEACAKDAGITEEAAQKMGIELDGKYHNHPDLARLLDEGYLFLTL